MSPQIALPSWDLSRRISPVVEVVPGPVGTAQLVTITIDGTNDAAVILRARKRENLDGEQLVTAAARELANGLTSL